MTSSKYYYITISWKLWVNGCPERRVTAPLHAYGAGAARADVVTYFHNDISGTPLAATDESGNLLWKESYRPYGERLLNGAGPDANRLWFGGKPQDPDTGLSYLGARYYSPQLGRFTGIDPKAVDPENLHGFNRYAYANNNPYKFVDPDGKHPLLLAAVGLGLWLGDALRPMPDVPPGSGMVEPASLPDLSGVLGAAKGLGVAAMAIRGVENTAAKIGVEAAAKGVGPLVGGGAKLENLTAQEIARIQNAANRTSTEISVVGSRANGTAGAMSDWDYVVPEATKSRAIHSLRSSLPEGPRGLGEPRNQDFSRATIDPDKPFITFTPQ